jgi:hypothetical protein
VRTALSPTQALQGMFLLYGLLGLISLVLYNRLSPRLEETRQAHAPLRCSDLSVATASTIFFWTGVCSAGSYLAAVPLAKRFSLVNTMVYTHLPSNVLLLLALFAKVKPPEETS